MSRDPDRRPEEPITFRAAEEASDRLMLEIERAKKLLREYRARLGAGPADNDKR